MSQQLNLFEINKPQCKPEQGQKVKYAVKETDLSGLTIKEQFNRLAAVAGGPGSPGHYNLERLLETKGYDYFDARDNWIDLPDYLRDKICEVFDLSTFPVSPAPMPRPVPPVPWYESMMDLPDATEFVKARPRDCMIVFATANPYSKSKERYELGPFQTHFIQSLPMEDRAKVRDFMRLHPNMKCMIDIFINEAPRRVMPEETKQKIRMLNMMRRAVKKYGFFAEDFARQECAARGWEWSDESWKRANQPPKKSKKPWGGKKKKGRSNDNDDLLAV